MMSPPRTVLSRLGRCAPAGVVLLAVAVLVAAVVWGLRVATSTTEVVLAAAAALSVVAAEIAYQYRNQ